MASLFLKADIVDEGLKLTGVILGGAGIGHALGVTAGFFSQKTHEQIERWGTIGTSVGSVIGVLLCAWALVDRT
jgi:hypothetical protein